MTFFSKLFGRKADTGKIARNRLQILLAHEHLQPGSDKDELLAKLQKEIMEVVRRHFPVNQEKVNIKMDTGSNCSTLAIDVEVPSSDEEKKS